MPESLEDHLRRATRNFTQRLDEDAVLGLGRDLARELQRAHAEAPPRFPTLEPAGIRMVEGRPRLEGGADQGRPATALFDLGALLHSLLSGQPPEVSWRLDGPPPVEASTLRRSATLRALAAPAGPGYPDAATAAAALERALGREADEAAPWPLFRGTPSRAGAPSAGVAPPTGLHAAWQAPVGAILASPLLTRDLAVVGSADGRVIVLDRETGGSLHQAKVASSLEASPALSGRAFFFGSDDGELIAVDAADGKVLYRVRLGETVRSSPLPDGDRVVVGAVEGKTQGSLVALEARTGKVVWKQKLGPVFSSPARAAGFLLVGSDDARLYAIRPEKGEVAWSLPMSGRVRATPAVAGDTAVVADFKGRVAAVRASDGTTLWTRELGESVYSSAALTPALAVLGCHDGKVYGLSLATGEPVFQAPTGGPVVSSPIALGDRFLAASTDGHLYLFDAAGRTLARQAVAGEGIQSSPALDAIGLVVGSGRGLHAFRLAP